MGASGGGLRTSETGGEGQILRLTSSSDFSFVLIFICTWWVGGWVGVYRGTRGVEGYEDRDILRLTSSDITPLPRVLAQPQIS